MVKKLVEAECERHDILQTGNKSMCHKVYNLKYDEEPKGYKTDIIRDRREIRVNVNTSISKENMILTIDSGAQISALKPGKIYKDTPVNIKRKTKVSGIVEGQELMSLGVVKAKISLDGAVFDHEFHIMGEDFNIKSDGILGDDFFGKFNADIRYGPKKLMLYNPTALEGKKNQTKLDMKKLEKEIEEERKGRRINEIPELKKVYPKKKNPDYYETAKEESEGKILSVQEQNEETEIIKSIPAILKAEKIQKFEEDFEEIMEPVREEKLTETERVENIMELIQLDQSEDGGKRAIMEIVSEFNDIFYLKGDEVAMTNAAEHRIQLLPDASPQFTKQFPIPRHQIDEVNRQVNELLEKGVIEPSDSCWNSPMNLVPKKDSAKGVKQQRLVFDYRKVNEVTETQTFPMPDLEEEISKMHGSKFFTTMDLHSAYHQIPLRPEDKLLTSFQTSNRKFQFTRMPFGLKGAPITWQRTINAVLGELLNEKVMAYMDDIICHSATMEEHMECLRKIFNKLRNCNFRLKPEKSSFLCREVRYLGHIINAEGVLTDPKKVEVINEFPIPQKMAEVQRFLGMTNYYRKYIPNFSKTARPLHNLTKKDTPFIWSEKCGKAFEELKKALINSPVLIFPDFTDTFYVTTDASNYAVGAVLSQGEIPDDRPIQYFSKTLGGAQLNYATIHKELLGIVLAIEQFRYYLYGKQFVVITDHRPLVALFKQSKLNSRLLRWKIQLAEYDFKIIHLPGKLNFVADCLSRIEFDPVPRTINEFSEGIDKEEATILVTTRSKAKEMQTNSGEGPSTRSEITRKEAYNIDEKRNIPPEKNNYDHIFYLLSDVNCPLKTKLEHKMKIKTIITTKVEELVQITGNRTIVFIPKIINEHEGISQTRKMMQKMYKSVLENNYERIAMVTDMRDPGTYFNFKTELRAAFDTSNVAITVYLNRVIQITEIEDIEKILQTYHKSILGGHVGWERMKNNIRRYYEWPSMTKDIQKYVKSCEVCEKTKVKWHTRMPMQVTTTAAEPFEKIYCDFVGEISPNSSEGHKHIFTVACDLTKYVIAVPVYDCTAETAARVIVEQVIIVFNTPKYVVSDNGRAFISDLFNEITKLFKIKHIATTPYRPQSNAVERFHKTLGQFLRAFTKTEPDEWHDYLKYATSAYNSTVNTVTGYSPRKLVFGFDKPLPIEIQRDPPDYNYESYKHELQTKLKSSRLLAAQHIKESKERNKRQYDKKSNAIELKVNDLVLRKNEVKKGKFDEVYCGPYRVEKINSPTNVIIRVGNKSVKTHLDKLIKAQADYGDKTPPRIEETEQ